jgi:hypothetical protein
MNADSMSPRERTTESSPAVDCWDQSPIPSVESVKRTTEGS